MYKRVSTAVHTPLFRLSISLIACAVLTVVLLGSWQHLRNILSDNYASIAMSLAIVFPLTGLNLYFEVKKWFALLQTKSLSISQGYLQVLSGICSGFITPNRLGEFAGRMAYLPQRFHPKAPFGAALGSMVQGSITLIFGLVGLIFYPEFPFHLTSLKGPAIMVILALLAVAAFFIFKAYAKFCIAALAKGRAYLNTVDKQTIAKVIVFALLRYMVFTTQFVLVLFFLGYTGTIMHAFLGVFLLYFCQSIIPGSAMGELGIREVLAMFIFGAFLPHPLLAALAGLLVWLANIGLPVLAGVSILGFSLRNESH